MKIEKLTDDKLKITLSIDDLEERNINLHSFMYNSPESQDLFWELLQTAEKDYGFHIDDGSRNGDPAGNGICDYCGKALVKMSDCTITLSYTETIYDGTQKKPEVSVSYIDHTTLQTDFRNMDDHRYLQSIAQKYGIWF